MKNQKIKKILYTAALVGTAILLVVSIIYFLSIIIRFRSDLTETTESLSLQMANSAANDINLVLATELARVDAMAEEIAFYHESEDDEEETYWRSTAKGAIERQLQDYRSNREHTAYIAADLRYIRKGIEYDSSGEIIAIGRCISHGRIGLAPTPI